MASDRYKILHGDALEVLRDLPDASVDFIFTDPPFGHKNNDGGDLIHRRECALGKQSKADAPRPIANDGLEANEIFRAFLPEAFRLLKPGSCICCCCGGGGPDPQFARWSLWLDEVFDFKQMVVWDKGKMGMGWHYRRSYETVLVATKKGAKCRWYDETNQIENVIRHIGKIIPQKDNHPTEKPSTLAAFFMRLHTLPGDTVLDPFMGSGSTGVAALNLDRRFIGIELSPEYIALAHKRIGAVACQEKLPLFVGADTTRFNGGDAE